MYTMPVKEIKVKKNGTNKVILKTEFFDEPEIWKPFIYDGKDSGWKISSYGRVMRRHNFPANILYDKDGYTRFSFYIPANDEIYHNSEPISVIVKTHRAVAEAFIENDDPINKTIVMHKNDIPSCNYWRNLTWGTPQDNMDDKKESNRSRYLVGEEKPDSKWTEKDAHFICKLLEIGKTSDEIAAIAGYSIEDPIEYKSYKTLIANIKRKHCWSYISEKYNI